jgi:4-amino-4-deoxy-L-arabinose transferase-like glycosyltransferase
LSQPTPAIVAQDAVRRLPRVALLLLCLAYIVPGFVGREPWRNADITAFGYMHELAQGATSWLSPRLAGQPPEFDALLPYWLGAWAMRVAPAWVAPDFAARVPFALMLALTLLAMWYGVYSLARSPRAQPVPFAFGGEANPADYARAMADGGLLALVATLGLAQFTHETTPSLAQLAFTAVAFFGMAALPRRPVVAGIAAFAGLAGLSLSGGPSMAVLFGAGALVVELLDTRQDEEDLRAPRWACLLILAAALMTTATLAGILGLYQTRLDPEGWLRDWGALGRLILWFSWPVGPLAFWTLWRWRRQLTSRHVALPLWFIAVSLGTAAATSPSDRSLLLALPAFATLAAFTLPTLSRSVGALIDWFTLLFFSGCALIIWVIWVSLQTGVPAKPAANVARLAPAYVPSFSFWAFAAALAATLAWLWLVRWRTGRHRTVMWKSLVLPAGGATLCWLLLMTLWLPVLDHARSYTPLAQAVQRALPAAPGCVEAFGLNRSQLASLRYHAQLDLRIAAKQPACTWLLASADYQAALPIALDMKQWQLVTSVHRPADARESVLVYHRAPAIRRRHP